MPRSRKQLITIGIFGLGETSGKNIAALLDDYIGETDVQFVIPATADHYSATVAAIVEYLRAEEVPYSVVTDATTAAARSLRGVVKAAVESHKATDVGTAMVNVLKDADDGRLFVLWDSEAGAEDGGAYNAVEYADECDLPVFDLCNGLEPVDLGHDDDDPIEEDEPEEKPTPRRRAAKTPEPEEDADDDAEAAEAPKRGRGRPAKVFPTHDPVSESLPTFAEASKLGVRALRTFARDLELAEHKAIGSMDAAAVLGLLYPSSLESAAAGAEAATLEEEISTAVHDMSAVGPAPRQHLNGEATLALGAFISMLAKEIALQVSEELASLER